MNKKNTSGLKISFRAILVIMFTSVSVIPFIVLQIYSYYRITNISKNNIDELFRNNLTQTSKIVNYTLEGYADYFYQIYTNDNLLNNIERIEHELDNTSGKGAVIRTLRAVCTGKSGIQGITISTSNGNTFFYDRIANSSASSPWMDSMPYTAEELLAMVTEGGETVLLTSRFARETEGDEYNLLHLVRPLINYKNLNVPMGIVMISIDERALNSAYNDFALEEAEENNNYSFIVNDLNQIISSFETEMIGKTLAEWCAENDVDYERLINSSPHDTSESKDLILKTDNSLSLGLKAVHVTNQGALLSEIQEQKTMTMAVTVAGSAALIGIIVYITDKLTYSIRIVNKAMQAAGKGDLDTGISEYKGFPKEIESIGRQFNRMIEQIKELIEETRGAALKQKDAELKTLEAQINPHFLYNVLDTVNWKAISSREFELSNLINSLAQILRYSIDKSSEKVPLKREAQWLERYVFLQQARSKNPFIFRMDIEEGLFDYPVHKLMMQPFIENSIIHGFKDDEPGNTLEVSIKERDGFIIILIRDNGCGMEEGLDQTINEEFCKLEQNGHLGMGNAIRRIQLYYGERAGVRFSSRTGVGTSVTIHIPK